MVLASPTSTLPGWRAPRPPSSCTRRVTACRAFQSLTRGFLPELDPLQRWVVGFILYSETYPAGSARFGGLPPHACGVAGTPRRPVLQQGF